jgi:hypothetical protein
MRPTTRSAARNVSIASPSRPRTAIPTPAAESIRASLACPARTGVGPVADGCYPLRSYPLHQRLLLACFVPGLDAEDLDVQLFADLFGPAMGVGRRQVDDQVRRQGGQPFGHAGDRRSIQSYRAVQVQHQMPHVPRF